MAGINPDEDFDLITAAIRSQNIDLLRSLLEDPNIADQNGNTALMVAAMQASPKCLLCLLQAGADTNLRDAKMNTALMIAVKTGNRDCVQVLLHHDANVHLENDCGDTALNISCLCGHVEIVEMLVNAGSLIDEPVIHRTTTYLSNAYLGRIGVVKDATDSGAYLERTESHRLRQLLMSATLHSLFKRGRIVFPLGSNSSRVVTAPVPDSDNVIRHIKSMISSLENRLGILGDTPLTCASREGHTKVCQYLLKLGARTESETTYGMTALSVAAANGHTEVVRLLLKCGVLADQFNTYGRTPLHIAAANGCTETAGLLLDAGANLEIVTPQLDTPLLLAVKHDQQKMVEFLVSRGASTNCMDVDDNTPLIVAAASDDSSRLIQYLLLFDPKVNWKNVHGQAALTVASRRGYVKNVQCLLAIKNIDVNTENKYGRTAIEEAVLECYSASAIVKLLAESGANLGDTVHYAVIRKNSGAVQSLLQMGAVPGLFSKSLSEVILSMPHIDRELSPLALSLCIGDLATAKFLIYNHFLHGTDQISLRHDTEFREYLRANGQNLSVEFLDQMFSQPWSLLSQSLITVSHILGYRQRRQEQIEQLNLPQTLVDKLLFTDVTTCIPISSWSNINFECIHGNAKSRSEDEHD